MTFDTCTRCNLYQKESTPAYARRPVDSKFVCRDCLRILRALSDERLAVNHAPAKRKPRKSKYISPPDPMLKPSVCYLMRKFKYTPEEAKNYIKENFEMVK